MSSNNREIPEEVVVEILLRLPVKTLVRCKTLSKHHHSLIRSRSFVTRHLQLITTTPRNTHIDNHDHHHALAFHFKNNFTKLETPKSIIYNESISLLSKSGLTITPLDWLPRFTMDHHRANIVVESLLIFGPVNGIYALTLQECTRILSNIILWNPATREHHSLPSSPLDGYMFEGFPNEDDFFTCGLGLDNSTSYFKVLVLPSKKRVAPPYLYGLQHGGWKDLDMIGSSDDDDDVFNYDSKILGRYGVYLHGSCHWVCVVVSKATLFILKFDMCGEVFESYPFPGVLSLPEPNNDNGCATVILQGCLGLVNVQENDPESGRSSCFDVWVMKEYGVVESWEILHRVSLPSGGAIARFLGIVEEDRFYVREQGEGWLVSYDIQDSSKEEQRYSVVDDTIERVLPYVETISRIEYESKKGDEEDQKKREELESNVRELLELFNGDFLKDYDIAKMASMFSSSDLDE